MSKKSKVAKTSLALLVAGTFSMSNTFAHASETIATDVQKESVSMPESMSGDQNSKAIEDAIKQFEETKTAAPSLLPGDFFYFAKLALENIKLAFTVNDEKEAKLLSQYASERLAEAEALFAEGKEDMAIQTIKDALDSMKQAQEKMGDEDQTDTGEAKDDGTVSDSTNKENTDGSVTSGEQKTNQQILKMVKQQMKAKL